MAQRRVQAEVPRRIQVKMLRRIQAVVQKFQAIAQMFPGKNAQMIPGGCPEFPGENAQNFQAAEVGC